MKVVSVVGARPNFVKAVMVSRQLRKIATEILVHTGQHYDIKLSHIFFEQLGLPKPVYNLEVGSGTHAQQTAEALIRIENVLLKEKPDWVIVYGDVNSTLAGSLAAAKLHIPIAHVEAGIRAYNKEIPEEINRVFTDYVSTLLFCPTQTAVENLAKESIKKGVFNTGDVMYDAVLFYFEKASAQSKIIDKLNLKSKDYLLTTLHRPSTTDNRESLFSVIKALSELDGQVIFPIHPRTRKAIDDAQIKTSFDLSNIEFIEPVSYFDMLILTKNAKIMITDSGGLQKEAYFLKTPCVTCIEEEDDEWPELAAARANRMVGTVTEKIIEAVNKPYPAIKDAKEFGDGNAARKMAALLEKGEAYG